VDECFELVLLLESSSALAFCQPTCMSSCVLADKLLHLKKTNYVFSKKISFQLSYLVYVADKTLADTKLEAVWRLEEVAWS